MSALQAWYRLLSWVAWALLLIYLGRLLPLAYYYSLDWHHLVDFSPVFFDDALSSALHLGLDACWKTILLGALPSLLFFAIMGLYWRRMSLSTQACDSALSWTSAILSLSAAWLCWLSLEQVGHNLWVWHLLTVLPNDEAPLLSNIILKGLLSSAPFAIVVVSAQRLLNAWMNWQDLHPLTGVADHA